MNMGYAADVEIITISETYNMSACVYFVPEGHIT
jgi:hypothetical protein